MATGFLLAERAHPVHTFGMGSNDCARCKVSTTIITKTFRDRTGAGKPPIVWGYECRRCGCRWAPAPPATAPVEQGLEA
ncbi:MAG: hypothetical protein M3O50_12610 [Myxococcota bacterium]|nr:hypothetical protein [Myxococcota bacterium]